MNFNDMDVILNVEGREDYLNCFFKYYDLRYLKPPILVEQGVDKPYLAEKFKDKVSKSIFVKRDPYYRRALGFNIGTSISDKSYVCFMDTDVIVEPDFWERTSKLEGDCIVPWRWMFSLTKETTLEYLSGSRVGFESVTETDGIKKFIDHFRGWSHGGIAIYKKDVFKRVGGMNLDFLVWGAVDEEVVDRIHHIEGIITRGIGVCFHLWHLRTTVGVNEVMRKELREKNEQIFLTTWLRLNKADRDVAVTSRLLSTGNFEITVIK